MTPSPRHLLALLLTTLACDTTPSNVCGADADCFSGEVCDRAIKECVPAGSADMRPDLGPDLGDTLDMSRDMFIDMMSPDVAADLDMMPDQQADMPPIEDMVPDIAPLSCTYNQRGCDGVCAIYPRAVGMEPPTCTGGVWTAGACRPGYTLVAGGTCQAQGLTDGVVAELGVGPHVIDSVLDAFGRVHLVVGSPTTTHYAVWDGDVTRWKVLDLGHKGRAVGVSVGYSGDAHIILQDDDAARYLVIAPSGEATERGIFADNLGGSGPADVAIVAHGGLGERIVGAWLDARGKITIKRSSTSKALLDAESTYQRTARALELELVLDDGEREIIFSIDEDMSGQRKLVAQRWDAAAQTIWAPAQGTMPQVRALHAINKSALAVGMLVDGTAYVSEPSSDDPNAVPITISAVNSGALPANAALQVADIMPPDLLVYLLDDGIKSALRSGTWGVQTVRPGQSEGLRVFGDKSARWAAFVEEYDGDHMLQLLKLP